MAALRARVPGRSTRGRGALRDDDTWLRQAEPHLLGLKLALDAPDVLGAAACRACRVQFLAQCFAAVGSELREAADGCARADAKHRRVFDRREDFRAAHFGFAGFLGRRRRGELCFVDYVAEQEQAGSKISVLPENPDTTRTLHPK